MLWASMGSRSLAADVTEESREFESQHADRENQRVISKDFRDDFNNFLLGEGVFENPDTLIREKGMRILDKMIDTDAEIKSNYDLKKFIRLSMGWSIKPAKQRSPQAEHVRDFVEWNLNVFMDCSMDSFLRKMMDASRQGFKIAELVWGVIDHGPWKGMIGLKNLIVRNSRHYSFAVDEHGALLPDGVVEGLTSTGFTTTTDGEPRRLPKDKFVIYSYNTLDDDGVSLYGRSDYRVLWRYYYGNMVAHLTHLRQGETFAEPPLLMKYPDGLYNKSEQLALQKEVAGAYGRKCTRVPVDIEIDTIETKRSHSGLGIDVMEYHGDQISRGLGLGPMMNARSERGASLGKEQFRAFAFMLDAVGRDMEEVVSRQIIRRLVEFNWETCLYPVFCMPSMSRDRGAMSTTIKTLVESGVVDPTEPWIREWIDIPNQISCDGEGSEAREDDQFPGFPDLEGEGGDEGDQGGDGNGAEPDAEEMAASVRMGIYAEVRDGELRDLGRDRPKQMEFGEGLGGLFIVHENDNGRTSLRAKISDGIPMDSARRLAQALAARLAPDGMGRVLLCRHVGSRRGNMVFFVESAHFDSPQEVREVVALQAEPGDMVVQTVILSKDRFKTLEKAKRWIERSQRFKVAGKVDETSSSYRFRQRDPGDFVKGELRTFRITDGVKAVWGPLRKSD